MCIICYSAGKKLTEKQFDNCWSANKDGFGLAWRIDNRLFYAKGLMKKEEALEEYNKLPEGLVHVAHFRTATAGGVKQSLTHPFIVSKRSELKLRYEGTDSLLFHNGVISRWEDILITYAIQNGFPKGDMSDSRLAALILNKTGKEILAHLSGKYVLFTIKNTILYGNFTKDDEISFSNSGYNYSRASYVSEANYVWGDWGGAAAYNRNEYEHLKEEDSDKDKVDKTQKNRWRGSRSKR